MIPSSSLVSFTNAALAAELDRLGIAWVVASVDDRPEPPLEPIELIVGLSSSDEARLRMALIPLFLARSEYADLAGETAATLSGQPRITLICYYTAAKLLQRKHVDRLEKLGLESPILRDWFSRELDLPDAGDPDTLLIHLAKRHAELSGRQLNWYGTYDQAARRFMQRLEQALTWTKP